MDKKELEQFALGKLDAERLFEVDEHVRMCSECRAALSKIPLLQIAGIGLGTTLLGLDDCPEYEDISAFVDESLSPEQMVSIQLHINSCEMCFSDVEKIREMRSHALLREKIVVCPRANRRSARHGFGWWKRVIAGVAGTTAVAAMAIAISSFVAKPEKPVMMTAKPPMVAHGVDGRGFKSFTSTGVQPKQSQSVDNTAKPHSAAPTPAPVSVASKAVLRDGSYQVIKQNGRLILANAKGESVMMRIAASIDEKLRTGKIKPGSMIRMAMVGVNMRSSEDAYTPPPSAPKLIEPINKIIMSDRPIFTWSKVDLAESYRVRVYDSHFQLVAEKMTNQTSILLPKALTRGVKYTWRVGVRFSESDSWAESAPAKFHVLSSEDYASIQDVEKMLPGSHLALGVAYESVGLYDEARREYCALKRLNRGSSLAGKMLYRTGN